jgi:hypothetical protein
VASRVRVKVREMRMWVKVREMRMRASGREDVVYRTHRHFQHVLYVVPHVILLHHLQYHGVSCGEVQSESARPCGHQQDPNIITAS